MFFVWMHIVKFLVTGRHWRNQWWGCRNSAGFFWFLLRSTNFESMFWRVSSTSNYI